MSGKRVHLTPGLPGKILDKVIADSVTLENRNNIHRETARQAREAEGNETYEAIKAIMAQRRKEGEDAKPREIWPDVQAAYGAEFP